MDCIIISLHYLNLEGILTIIFILLKTHNNLLPSPIAMPASTQKESRMMLNAITNKISLAFIVGDQTM